MCLATTPVGGIGRWNWDGDAVVFDTTVPSQRPVAGGKRHYQIDVREFLINENNAVLRSTLSKIRIAAKATVRRGDERFEARVRGAFDFRARVIEDWVAREIRYIGKRGRDPWQFPEETLTRRGGDCEDLAFLIASLLLGSGISGYHVRVALGEVRVGLQRFDHAWVVYKNESGQWTFIDPFVLRARLSPAGARTKRLRLLSGPVRYTPSFLFNDEHLWIVVRRGNPGSIERVANRTWNRMSPKFAGDVHLSILERALGSAPASFVDRVRGRFRRLALVGPVIDAPDWVDVLNPSSTPCDPRQHFDNGLIGESWDLLERNAEKFLADRDDVDAFGNAAHAIADIYSHSSYLHFAWTSAGPLPSAKPFHPDTWSDNNHVHDQPDYGPGEDPATAFDFRRFTENTGLWKDGVEAGVTRWNGKIVSGRYAQSSKDHYGSATSKLAESLCSLPARFVRPEIGALPHHSEIAVDEADWSSDHRLYDPRAFVQQFQLRFNTAVEHVRNLYDTGVP